MQWNRRSLNTSIHPDSVKNRLSISPSYETSKCVEDTRLTSSCYGKLTDTTSDTSNFGFVPRNISRLPANSTQSSLPLKRSLSSSMRQSEGPAPHLQQSKRQVVRQTTPSTPAGVLLRTKPKLEGSKSRLLKPISSSTEAKTSPTPSARKSFESNSIRSSPKAGVNTEPPTPVSLLLACSGRLLPQVRKVSDPIGKAHPPMRCRPHLPDHYFIPPRLLVLQNFHRQDPIDHKAGLMSARVTEKNRRSSEIVSNGVKRTSEAVGAALHHDVSLAPQPTEVALACPTAVAPPPPVTDPDQEARKVLEEKLRTSVEAKERLAKLSAEFAAKVSDHLFTLNAERDMHKTELELAKQAFEIEREKEFSRVHKQRAADIEELQRAYESQLTEERRAWAARMTDASVEYVKKLEKQKSEHETKMADLERENANRIGEMTEKFNRLKADLSKKVDLLQDECTHLRQFSLEAQRTATQKPSVLDKSTQVPQEFGGLENSILQHLPPDESSEQTALHHSFRSAHSAAHSAVKRTVTLPPQSSIERIQSAPARSRTPFAVGFCSPQPPRANRPESERLEEEIKSLNIVLQLKSNELVELRRKTMEQEQQLEEYNGLKYEVNQLRHKNENLNALLELQTEEKKALEERYQNLFQNLDREIREKKKCKMDLEELKFKMDHVECTHAKGGRSLSEVDEADIASFSMTRSMHSAVRMRKASW